MSQSITREEKVSKFFKETKHTPRWCENFVCACIGCVNINPPKKQWYAMFPNDPFLRKEDIEKFKRFNQ